MFTGLYVSAAGMLAQMKNMDVISNNLANINTSGFKKDKSIFRSFYDDAINSAAAPQTSSGAPLQNKGLNSMAIIERTISVFSDGVIKKTDNDLDLAIQGDGFFELQGANGETFFARAGNFQLNEESEIVNADGLKLMGEFGIMFLKEDVLATTESKDVTFDETGVLKIGDVEIDRVSIYRFVDNDELKKTGHGLFVNNGDENISDEPFDGKIVQRYLEMSNVNPIEEMAEMISSTRAFEAYLKVVRAIMDNTTEKMINIVGRNR